MPTYEMMNKRIQDKVHFQIMNGDFIYENGRRLPVEDWREDVGISADQTPSVVDVMPEIVGIWENYKRYYDGSPNLREWHRNMPAYFMFDDHEILNDINGAGTPGHKDRKALHRDIGIQAWYDYVGWSNPIPEERQEEIIYGKADLKANESVLHDSDTDFSKIDFSKRPTLHVHWNDDHKNARVYEVKEVLDNHRIRLNPSPKVDAEDLSYSIGRRNYYSFKQANAEFFVTDTRSGRGLHDQDRPEMEGLTMLGEQQKQWLIESMRESDADFLFVVSSVTFSIPHVDPNIPNKDESWTVFLDERDQLMEFWDGLDQQVVLLTGDLHNGIALNISDNINEFVSGPHASGNHDASDEGHRPPNGEFTYNDRTVDILWSSYFKENTRGSARTKRYYVVFDINNVVHNPTREEDRWIAYPRPQLVVQYYNGRTGELEFSRSIRANK
jgi:phosphodiesterase/alkaline phosphatase D-like protein